jgi:hypothetical protein
MLRLRNPKDLSIDRLNSLQRWLIPIDFGLMACHKPNEVRIVNGNKDHLSSAGLDTPGHRIQMIARLLGWQKLLFVQRIVRAREYYNVVGPEPSKGFVQPGIQLGCILSREAVINNVDLSSQRPNRDEE